MLENMVDLLPKEPRFVAVLVLLGCVAYTIYQSAKVKDGEFKIEGNWNNLRELEGGYTFSRPLVFLLSGMFLALLAVITALYPESGSADRSGRTSRHLQEERTIHQTTTSESVVPR